MKHDHLKPMRGMPPEYYIILEKTFQEYKLMDVEEEILKDYQKFKKIMEKRTIVSPIKNYSYKFTKGIWESTHFSLLSNEQKDRA